MKKSDIKNLKFEEFKKLLTPKNYDYIAEYYPSFERAFECYQEGADANDEDTYLGVNEYFELNQEQDELLNEYYNEK